MTSDSIVDLLKSLESTNLRRSLWLLMVVIGVLILFEVQTKWVEMSNISNQIDMANALAENITEAEQRAELKEIQGELVSEMKRLREGLSDPFNELMIAAFRFFQGALPVLLLTLYIMNKLRKNVPWRKVFEHFRETPQVAAVPFYFGLKALAFLLWVATFLGYWSIIWNTSDSLIIQWLVFPIISLILFLLFIGWAFVVYQLVPRNGGKKEEKQKISTPKSDVEKS